MTDTGLSNRLRQHSRRSGIVIGLSMAITIALCIGTSAWIFGQAEPYVADFTGFDEEPEPTEVVAEAPSDEADQPEENSQESQSPPENEDEPANPDQQPTVAPAPTATESTFNATHLSNPDFTVNLRPGPSVGSGEPITTVPPNTPLQALGDQGQDEDGLIWLLVQTEDGTEGWIRDVDTVEIV